MVNTTTETDLVRNILELPLEQQIFALGFLVGIFSMGFIIGGMYRRYEVAKVQAEKAGLENMVGELERQNFTIIAYQFRGRQKSMPEPLEQRLRTKTILVAHRID